MITENQLQEQADSVYSLYSDLQQQIFDRFIYYLGDSIYTKVDKDNAILWQAEQLSKMGMLTNDVIKLLAETTGTAELKIKDMIINNGIQVDSEVRAQLSKMTNRKPINDSSHQVLSSLLNQTFGDLNNVVNQSLVSRNVQNNAALRTYQDIVNQTTIETVSGLKTHEKAIFDNIYKWVNHGLPTNLVDKGGHNWSLEGYTRTVITSTAHRTFNDTRMKAMDDYDVTLAAMTSHSASRPACAPIQGKVVNTVPSSDHRYNPKYDSIYNHDYGKASGTQGANCHHELYPYIEGVSTNPFKHPNTEEAIANGVIQQHQRALERKVRHDKKMIHYAESMHDDIGVRHYKDLMNGHRDKLRGMINDHDFLHRDYSREKVLFSKRNSYNNSEDTESQKHVKMMVDTGQWGTKVNEDKQKPHMESTRIKGKSFFKDDVDIQELLDRYSGTGTLNKTKQGFGNKELVKNVNLPGSVLTKDGEMLSITGITIHHSAKRTHIVPYTERTKD